MTKSDSIKELATALVKAQAKIKLALKDSSNPFFHSKYADLESVWGACRDALNSEGLAVAQTLDGVQQADGNWTPALETILVHTSGEWIRGFQPLKPAVKETKEGLKTLDDPQSVGSAITYARRYGLAAMVGVVQTDDDGNEASGNRPDAHHNAPPVRQDSKIEAPKPPIDPKPTQRPTSGATGKHAEIKVSESGDMATITGWLDNAAPRKDKKKRDFLMLTIDDVSVSCFDNKLWASVQAYKGRDVKAFVDIAKVGDKTYYNLISVVPVESVNGIAMAQDTSGPWDGGEEPVPF